MNELCFLDNTIFSDATYKINLKSKFHIIIHLSPEQHPCEAFCYLGLEDIF
jgi:hypothetical protein